MAKAPCIKVPRRRGEEARRMLIRVGVLRRDLRPFSTSSHVFFPLTRPLTGREAEMLGGEPCMEEFGERGEGARSIGEVLREMLGSAAPRVSSYYVVGDIAVVSLTPRIARYAGLIGEAIARVQRNVKAVYGKTGTTGEYRVQRLIHLYGEKRTQTIYRENGLRFWVDIGSMYVNPSLASEHLRVAHACRDGEAVLDMFAGFGGFSINIAAARRALVVAVDINPSAIEALRRSLAMNRLRGLVEPLHADSGMLDSILRKRFNRIVMNLPHRSSEYMGVACRLAEAEAWIHVYLLAGSRGEAAGKAEEAAVKAGCLGIHVRRARRVIDYAPRRYIYSVDMQVGSNAMSTR